MTCVTNGQTQGPCPSFGFNSSTNQINNTGYTYDAAGNLTADGTGTGTHTYQWDAENRMTSIDSGTTSNYTYNALGQRVEKKVGSAYTEFMFDASGQPVGENNRTSWSVSAVSFPGRHLAHYQSSATYFMHGNKLGSTPQATDYSGTVAQDQLYYPWGQDWAMVGTSQEKRFASLQHRDTTETGLDPTHFRMFSSTQGRWFSVDPVSGDPGDPQSLDLYAYSRNGPVSLVDPYGLEYCKNDDAITDPTTGKIVGYDPSGCMSDAAYNAAGDPQGYAYLPSGAVSVVINVTIYVTPSAPMPGLTTLLPPFAGSITGSFPVAGALVGLGPTIPLAYVPSTGQFCGGLGVAVTGPAGKTVNAGPLIHGYLPNTSAILSGFSLSANVQLTPTIGYQVIWNSSGVLGGPTAGSLGVSLSATYSGCTSPR